MFPSPSQECTALSRTCLLLIPSATSAGTKGVLLRRMRLAEGHVVATETAKSFRGDERGADSLPRNPHVPVPLRNMLSGEAYVPVAGIFNHSARDHRRRL